MTKENLSFKIKNIVKKLLSSLSDRARDIIIKRYGLDKNPTRMTLEAIGKEYKITRERVRQIENFAINAIKKSDTYQKSESDFSELKKMMEDFGGIVHEIDFLESISKNQVIQNLIHFMLVLSDDFSKLKENGEFHHSWTTNKELTIKVHESIKNLCQNFTENDLVSEQELITRFLGELKEIVDNDETRIFAKKWLAISKNIGENPLGEWGLIKSPNVKMRGIRDYAYLVIRQNGSPMHFIEVAKAIDNTFNKKAHPATCHNELIKDKRFVLVGRGLYALAEWGYTKGIVADVIRTLLEKEGPLSKEEIVSKVLKERHVKENTIIVNLQNPKYFYKQEDGKYVVV